MNNTEQLHDKSFGVKTSSTAESGMSAVGEKQENQTTGVQEKDIKKDQQMGEKIDDVQEVRQKRSSILFEPLSLVLLIVALLLSIWFKLYILIGMLSFLLFLSFFIYLSREHSLRKIDVNLNL